MDTIANPSRLAFYLMIKCGTNAIQRVSFVSVINMVILSVIKYCRPNSLILQENVCVLADACIIHYARRMNRANSLVYGKHNNVGLDWTEIRFHGFII